MPDQALSGINVLDIGQYVAGPYCTKLLADYGADVVKLERPGRGDPSRSLGPFPGDTPDPEASGLFLYLNNNKKGITLNLKSAEGNAIFKELVRHVDILVENFPPRVMPGMGLGFDTLKALNPGLIVASISSFGQSGRYRDYKATDIVLQSLAGWVHGRGRSDREPIRAMGKLGAAGYIGGMFGAAAVMAAWSSRTQDGCGQHIDVSTLEAVHMMLPYCIATSAFPNNPGWPNGRIPHIPGVEECKDGYIGINTLTGAHWRDLCHMMGMHDWAEDPNYQTRRMRAQRARQIRDRMKPWLMSRTRHQVMQEGQDWRVPVALVYSPEGMLHSPQYVARDYFVDVSCGGGKDIPQPGSPFNMMETPWELRRLAPRLGQHNEEVYGSLLGCTRDDLAKLRQAGAL